MWAGLIGLVMWPLMVALQLGPMPFNAAIKLKLHWAAEHQLGGLLPWPVPGGKHTHGAMGGYPSNAEWGAPWWGATPHPLIATMANWGGHVWRPRA